MSRKESRTSMRGTVPMDLDQEPIPLGSRIDASLLFHYTVFIARFNLVVRNSDSSVSSPLIDFT